MNRSLAVATLFTMAASAVVSCSSSDSLPASGAVDGGGGSSGTADGGTSDAAVPDPVRASDYDQTCATNTDCALVTEASVCAVCSCENAAVRVEEKAEFVAARAAQTCPNPPSGVACGACQTGRALCENATCTFSPYDETSLRASDFPGACTTAADCLAVHEGDVCDACQCPNAAIPRSQGAAFTAAKAGVRCGTPGACVADCAARELACVEQQCTLLDP